MVVGMAQNFQAIPAKQGLCHFVQDKSPGRQRPSEPRAKHRKGAQPTFPRKPDGFELEVGRFLGLYRPHCDELARGQVAERAV
jgi:hypothetical protein